MKEMKELRLIVILLFVSSALSALDTTVELGEYPAQSVVQYNQAGIQNLKQNLYLTDFLPYAKITLDQTWAGIYFSFSEEFDSFLNSTQIEAFPIQLVSGILLEYRYTQLTIGVSHECSHPIAPYAKTTPIVSLTDTFKTQIYIRYTTKAVRE